MAFLTFEMRLAFSCLNQRLYFPVPPKIYVPEPHVLKLENDWKNITIDCYGFGKPLPSVVWKRYGVGVKNVSTFSSSHLEEVVQVIRRHGLPPWNVASRLYLRTGGITYNESGNYTCEVFNGVGGNLSTERTIEVLCMYATFLFWKRCAV